MKTVLKEMFYSLIILCLIASALYIVIFGPTGISSKVILNFPMFGNPGVITSQPIIESGLELHRNKVSDVFTKDSPICKGRSFAIRSTPFSLGCWSIINNKIVVWWGKGEDVEYSENLFTFQ